VDDSWEVGSTYVVCGEMLPVWSTVDMMVQPVATLNKLDEVTVLEVFDGPQIAIARVFPRSLKRPEVNIPGFVLLEDRTSEDPPAVLKRHLQQKSWSVGGRYMVQCEATVREGIELDTPVVQDLYAHEEVLLLEIGASNGTDEVKPRLRFKVATDRGCVGWMSGITTKNDVMLNAFNLLAPQVVHLRKSYRDQEGKVFPFPSRTGKLKSFESRQSSGGSVCYRSWIPQGEYRVLQATELRAESNPSSPVVAKLEPGMSVVVENLAALEEDGRPVALVKIAGDSDSRGWVQLIAPNGFDNVDTRDLTEFDKVQAWLQQGGGGGDDGADEGAGRAAPPERRLVTPDFSPEGSQATRGEVADMEGIQLLLGAEGGEGSGAPHAPPASSKRHPRKQEGVLSVAGRQCMAGCLPSRTVRAR